MKPPITIPKTPGWVQEFRDFIARGNVVDLAVGVSIGAAFTTIVNSLVKDIFNPVLGLVTGGVDFSNVFVPLNGQHYSSLDEARRAGAPTVNIGLFINACIQFVIVAFVIFWVIKAMSRFLAKRKAEAPKPTRSEELLAEIRDLLSAKPNAAVATPPPITLPRSPD
jgi:large conductance mechanosensitive channel